MIKFYANVFLNNYSFELNNDFLWIWEVILIKLPVNLFNLFIFEPIKINCIRLNRKGDFYNK